MNIADRLSLTEPSTFPGEFQIVRVRRDNSFVDAPKIRHDVRISPAHSHHSLRKIVLLLLLSGNKSTHYEVYTT